MVDVLHALFKIANNAKTVSKDYVHDVNQASFLMINLINAAAHHHKEKICMDLVKLVKLKIVFNAITLHLLVQYVKNLMFQIVKELLVSALLAKLQTVKEAVPNVKLVTVNNVQHQTNIYVINVSQCLNLIKTKLNAIGQIKIWMDVH